MKFLTLIILIGTSLLSIAQPNSTEILTEYDDAAEMLDWPFKGERAEDSLMNIIEFRVVRACSSGLVYNRKDSELARFYHHRALVLEDSINKRPNYVIYRITRDYYLKSVQLDSSDVTHVYDTYVFFNNQIAAMVEEAEREQALDEEMRKKGKWIICGNLGIVRDDYYTLEDYRTKYKQLWESIKK